MFFPIATAQKICGKNGGGQSGGKKGFALPRLK
jgi:hypothetical protein